MKNLVIALIFLAPALPAVADSLFNQAAQKSGTLISSEVKKYEVGDLITVLVRERVEASTLANTNTRKESDVESKANPNRNRFVVGDGEDERGLISERWLPNWQVESENETRNVGSTRRTSTLTTTIACFVTEVLENGNLKVEGEKTVTINREDTTLLVSGTIRPRDVGPDNSIPSTMVANANVLLKGKGPLWNNQRRGLVTRFLDWFSPF
jgi:flagellar L-ring protein FlgH